MNTYNSINANQARLHEISLDDVSGIDTMVNNMNKSSNMNVVSLRQVSPAPIVIKNPLLGTAGIRPIVVLDSNHETTLPDTKVTIINPIVEENKKNQSVISKLTDKQKGNLIFGLFGVSLILLVIVILK